MKKSRIFQILIILIFYNCSTKKYEEKLIGNWYPTEKSTLQELQISMDSLIILNDIGNTHQTWNADKSHINLYNIRYYNFDSVFKKNFTYEYLLSDNNDTLYLKVKNDTSNKNYKFNRIKNRIEHFQNTIDLKFDLPESKSNLISIGDDNLNPHYYIGFKNDKLLIKNNILFIDLKDVYGEIFQLKLQLEQEDFEKLKIVLFTDRNIPEFKIDSIKNILRQTQIKRIFRIYKNDTINYKDNLNWYGKSE